MSECKIIGLVDNVIITDMIKEMKLSKGFKITMAFIASIIGVCLVYALPHLALWYQEDKKMAEGQVRVQKIELVKAEKYQKYITLGGELGRFTQFKPSFVKLRDPKTLFLYGFIDGTHDCTVIDKAWGSYCGNKYTKLIAYDVSTNKIIQPLSDNATKYLSGSFDLYANLKNIIFLQETTLLIFFDKILALDQSGQLDSMKTEKLNLMKFPKFITSVGDTAVIFWYQREVNDYPCADSNFRENHPIESIYGTLLNSNMDEQTLSIGKLISPYSDFVYSEDSNLLSLIVDVISSVDVDKDVDWHCVEDGNAEDACATGEVFPKYNLEKVLLQISKDGSVNIKTKSLPTLKNRLDSWRAIHNRYFAKDRRVFPRDGANPVSAVFDPFQNGVVTELKENCNGLPKITSIKTMSENEWLASGKFYISYEGKCREAKLWKFNSDGDIVDPSFSINASQTLGKYESLEIMELLSDNRIALVGRETKKDEYGNISHFVTEILFLDAKGTIITD